MSGRKLEHFLAKWKPVFGPKPGLADLDPKQGFRGHPTGPAIGAMPNLGGPAPLRHHNNGAVAQANRRPAKRKPGR
jgi:hypothetical protein